MASPEYVKSADGKTQWASLSRHSDRGSTVPKPRAGHHRNQIAQAPRSQRGRHHRPILALISPDANVWPAHRTGATTSCPRPARRLAAVACIGLGEGFLVITPTPGRVRVVPVAAGFGFRAATVARRWLMGEAGPTANRRRRRRDQRPIGADVSARSYAQSTIASAVDRCGLTSPQLGEREPDCGSANRVEAPR